MRRPSALLLSFFVAGAAPAATVEEDVQRFLQVLDSNTAAQAEQLEKLSGMGLSDPRLFDPIERRLLADAEAARGENIEKNRVAWYFRALGFSGDAKYQPTLSQYTGDRTYRNYAINALKDMGDYARWNPVISDRKTFVTGLSDDSNRALNMVRSSDMNLVKLGAKRIYFAGAEEPVLDYLAGEIKAKYMSVDADNADTMAWMIKALGRAGPGKYAALLEEIKASAPDRKVRNQADSSLRPPRAR
jgi:hypothetical protein